MSIPLPIEHVAAGDATAVPATAATLPPSTDADEGTSTFSGVHDITKSVDVWFAIEVSQIEKEADAYAEQWAHENLPTLAEVNEELLSPEKVLLKRCGELWQRWPRRIHTKFQDAIDGCAEELGKAVSGARASITEMRLARTQIREAEERMEDIRAETAANQGPVRYNAYIAKWWAHFLAFMLITVEFIANQPVFRVIWPINADVEAELSGILQDVAAGGPLAGPKIALIDAISHFEASMLALVVVVLLYILAKSLGTSLRPIVALKPVDYPFASRSIASLHRQKWVMFGIALLGTFAVIWFLYASRGSASSLVAERLKAATAAVERINTENAARSARGEILGSDRALLLEEATANQSRLENTLGFAQTIEANNFTILVLNLSLVCFALVLGFMSDSRDIADTMGEHPELRGLKERVARLTESLVRQSALAHDHLMKGDRAIARLNSLLRSDPLSTLEAKRSRLESIIPRWRARNAVLRGLDPTSIAAFRRDVPLILPTPGNDTDLVKPDGFDSNVSELRSLGGTLYSVDRELDTQRLVAA
ncbi:MAG: hypothetical protein C0503_01200 [Gemmatimonas sp.]|nr:hypothetical protein [Gemmatimonas sp.]